ncbi:lytic murein transglycosylase [Isoalcanivorax indicus]|uniref:lytic murein transglycosylase n=1 Tax=Isoalcanivorax indicus TaxID=2202653 RepID=UPI000DB8FD29|nr:lytic murein transglycosylase [Isoalcanivorax indicus]
MSAVSLFRFPVVAAVLAFLFASSPAWAIPDAETFAACVSDLGHQARQAGVSAPVVARSLDTISLNERVIELDRAQPEFTASFAGYFNTRMSEQRIQRGREMYREHRTLLERVAREYGVPAQYLVAFWGMETNYGSFFGRMSILDSLATLACEGRRGAYFSTEFVNALRIIDEGAITAERMQGSWAGAMGHVQFMPSVFLQHAVDYDGDGRRDLWGSIPDAMASAANFLSAIGWQTGERWGREVRLPSSFPFEHAGLNQRKTLTEWRQLGVRMADGSALPNADMQASLLLPSGHRGPAFLVYDNFRVIMRWNRSEFYALSVGHLADRIAGGGALYRAPVEAPRLHRDQVKQLQTLLNDKGHDAGEVDGILGPGTRTAISRYQQAQGMVADGFPDRAVLTRIGLELD